MSGDAPIQMWWPNYPHPVQMYLVWGTDNQPRLAYNDAELTKNYFTRPLQYEVDEEHPLVIDEGIISEKPAITQGHDHNQETVTTTEVQGHQEKEEGWMRPHKKRPFHMDIDRRDCRLDIINVADDKQDNTLYPTEENEKERGKEKDGMPRGRKRWKRKISRKQFRHHDIKLFTPCEYKTTSMLKQKEPSNQETQKPGVIQKESVTDAIVHSLTGQKQQVPPENNIQKRLKVDDVLNANAKTNLEENNNITTTENHNTGKHHLPAIIMETPTNTRTTRSIWPKNLIDCYQNSNKITIEDQVSLELENTLNAELNSTRSDYRQFLQSNEDATNFEPLQPERNNVSPPHYRSARYCQNSENQQLNEEMDIGNHENEQPEDLSIQTPVDLSKKTPIRPKVQEVQDMNPEPIPLPNVVMENVIENEPVQAFIPVNNSNHSSKSSSPEVITTCLQSHRNKQWYYTNPHMIPYVNHIMLIFEEIRHILSEPFSDELIGKIQYVYQELKKIKEEESIPIKLKIEAQNLSSQVEKFIIARPKVKPVRDVDPWRYRHLRLPDVSKYNLKRPSEVDNAIGTDQNLTIYRSKSQKIEKTPKRLVRRTMSHPETIEDKTNVVLSGPLSRSNLNHLGMLYPLPSNPILNVPPSAYSDFFYESIQKHISNGNPLPVSVHPHRGSNYMRRTSNSQGITIPPQRSKTPPAILNTNEREEVLSSSNYSENTTVTSPSPSSFSQQKPPKKTSIPAVIVADNSMEITKEPNEPVRENVRIQSAKNQNPTPEPRINKPDVFDKDPDENNTEFLKWLEKLKSDEILKNKFLSKMGISKESEIDKENDDTIEIVDSDDEQSEPQIKQYERQYEEPVKKPLVDQFIRKSLESPTIIKYPEQNKPKTSHSSLSNIKTSITLQTSASIQTTTSPVEQTKVPTIAEPLTKLASHPIADVPSVGTGEKHRYLAPLQNKEKVTYSPQIEPISPVGNETGFVFTELSPAKPDKAGFLNNSLSQKNTNSFYKQLKNINGVKSLADKWKSIDRPQAPCSPRVAPHGKLRYIRENHMFIRYFDDTQVALFNLSIQSDELIKTTGINPNNFDAYNKRHLVADQQMNGTEIIELPRDVEFSRKEDLREVEEFVKERTLVEKYVPKDFADFYIYVTGFQIVKMNPPVSLQTFLAMYNTNRTSELLKKYLHKIDESGPVAVVK